MPSTPALPRRVLLVDDDVLVSAVVRDLLEEAGLTVIGVAHDGRQAIDLAASLNPDIVFMDIEMPGMDGLDATRHINEQCPRPVILLTAHDDLGLVEQGSRAGAVAYLIKPPNLGEMTRTIVLAQARFADLMELRRTNAELRAALGQVRQLSALLPICAACKRVRDEAGYWQSVEDYLASRSNVQFTHGLCEKCLPKYFPDCGSPQNADSTPTS